MCDVITSYISASCNCTHSCLELTSEYIVYGSNHSLVTYSFLVGKVVSTQVCHSGRVNCVRFVKDCAQFSYSEGHSGQLLLTAGSDGTFTLWKKNEDWDIKKDNRPFCPVKTHCVNKNLSVTVADGICLGETVLVTVVTTDSKVLVFEMDLVKNEVSLVQEFLAGKGLALDVTLHSLDTAGINLVLAMGMDTGAVVLYGLSDECGSQKKFEALCSLNKHEDWVRCITFIRMDDGISYFASGGEDAYIAVWKMVPKTSSEPLDEFEFQVHHFKDFVITFDSMIIGHEGWINSLQWNSARELLSCSADQSTIIWESSGDIWMEKSRLGVVGGPIPGCFGARFTQDKVVTWGFQGAIQQWSLDDSETWQGEPSICGHFEEVSDLDYDLKGRYIVTTSRDQTTRIHAPWGKDRSFWHEIARPQIHGHDLFAVRVVPGGKIVSGAEEKIVRAFLPPKIFLQCLQNVSNANDLSDFLDAAAASASLPALGLSNQSEADISIDVNDTNAILDEDFLRSSTLWPEVSKLYGHVYEICCLASSPVHPIVTSASNSSKPQFSSIMLWCALTWKQLGEFPFHKLNVTGMEFSTCGKKLLSVSRDRTWAVWKVFKEPTTDKWTMELACSGSGHTRALWIGTWCPSSSFFVTGARDKKLSIWTENVQEKDVGDTKSTNYAAVASITFSASVSAIAVNADKVIAVGLESGEIHIYRYQCEIPEPFQLLKVLDTCSSHHDVVKRLQFNPRDTHELASISADQSVKIFRLSF